MNVLRLVICTLALTLASTPVVSAEVTPAHIWQSGPTCRMARVAAAPSLQGDDPLADPAWRRAESLGPLFSKGRPESPDRRTDARMLLNGSVLYVGVRCHDPAPGKIVKAVGHDDIGDADSLEFLLTAADERAFPYLLLRIDPGGLMTVRRFVQPFGIWAEPLVEKSDPAHITARTGIDGKGWWTLIAIPLARYGIAGPPIRANVLRSRSADKSKYTWVDLWVDAFIG